MESMAPVLAIVEDGGGLVLKRRTALTPLGETV